MWWQYGARAAVVTWMGFIVALTAGNAYKSGEI